MSKRPLYNSRLIDTFIKLIRKKYTHIDGNEILRSAGIKPYEVADHSHWFTQREVDLFYENLILKNGNQNIAREAGRFAASSDALGAMKQYVLSLLGPATIFEFIGKTAKQLTRASKFESRKMGGNQFEIIVTPEPGVVEKPYQCDNRMGILEAIPLIFGNNIASIEHPECIFTGGTVCRYIVKWRQTPAERWRLARNLSILLSIPLLLAVSLSVPSLSFLFISAITIILLLSMALFCEFTEKKDLKYTIGALRETSAESIVQMNVNYNNALLSNEIGQAISKKMQVEDILAEVLRILEKRLDYDRGMILLANEEKTKLCFHGGFGYSEELSTLLRNSLFSLDNPESKGLFVVSFHRRKAFLINDCKEIEADLSPHSLDFARKIGAKSFICCPIICDDESLGILAVDNISMKKPLLQLDLSLLSGIAPVIGISIRNAMLAARELHMVEQLRQAQKMEAVGRLAGGIAHDFNNLLTVISGYGDLLVKRLGDDSPHLKEVEEIRKAGKRAAGLTSQLLAFSRRQLLQPKVVDLNEVVTDIDRILRRLIGEDIDLVTVKEPLLGRIKADPGQLEQVIINLSVNARDAMPDGGKLTIRTANIDLDHESVSEDGPIVPGRYVSLTVSDNGCGIDNETISHVFEPFFTTKSTGKGTGLGLATVYGIIKQSDGHISVESSPGLGTCFTIYLPQVDEEPDADTEGDNPEPSDRNRETILVVEDEKIVRELVCSVLKETGYVIHVAENAEEAIKICSRLKEPVHLLLSDVIMPAMNGRELAQRLMKKYENLTVLYMSGYTDSIIAQHGVLEQGTAFIGKPFTPEALIRKVRETLDKAGLRG
ncbi:MAG: ATP-binding protein [Geobacteraceae bacterium]|nr:ATP-binding protein [Geobacteraceae bacterium]